LALTPVAPGFEWREVAAGRVLVSRALEALAPHLFTTRDAAAAGAAPDYRSIAAALGTGEDAIVWVRQVHGAGVLVVRPGDTVAVPPEADAIVSFDPARVILVRVADCVPVLIADRRQRVVAAVHAGWRGMAEGAIGAAVEALARDGIQPHQTIAAVGPSIGPCCYQVDTVVRDTFRGNWAQAGDWFTPDGDGRWRLDLWAAARDQLVQAGLEESAIHGASACTAHHPEDWWSFRRDGAAAGRMVAAIALDHTPRGPA
jgi:hypothetical protein